MEELFPLPFARVLQRAWRGEQLHQGPGAGFGPVVEGCQRGGKVFGQRRQQLVDQGGALFDEADLVAAAGAQEGGGLVLRVEHAPAVTVGAQGVGQAPGVVAVELGAAGGLAFAVAFGGLGIDRVERPAVLEELIDGGTAGGFQGQRTAGEGLHFGSEFGPAGSGVGEPELGGTGAGVVHDDDIVVVAGPVEGREVGVGGPVSIHGASGAQRAGPLGRARPDTGALRGRCSLSAWPRGRHRRRRSQRNPRGVRTDKPWLRCGQLLTAGNMPGGGVIHQLGRSRLGGRLPSLVNNSGRRIRAGERGASPWRAAQFSGAPPLPGPHLRSERR